MIGNKVYKADEISFSIKGIPNILQARKILMCTPSYFEVLDVKNVHMQAFVGATNKSAATKQWEALKAIYDELQQTGFIEEVCVIDGAQGCEDMVFTANQSFPWLLNDDKVVLMSQMRHESRRKEVPFFKKFYEARGYQTLELEKTDLFEGMGDTIPHPKRNLLFGGYGHRSKPEAYEELSKKLEVPIVTLELVDDRFYHLDTCFIPIDDTLVFLCKEAFSADGLKAINAIFDEVVAIPIEEAVDYFALNAHCMDFDNKRVAIVQQGTTVMKAALESRGFKVYEIDTSEYMKSGGSVFCMKMMMY